MTGLAAPTKISGYQPMEQEYSKQINIKDNDCKISSYNGFNALTYERNP